MNYTGHIIISSLAILYQLTLFMVRYLHVSTLFSRQSIRLYWGFTTRKHMEAGLSIPLLVYKHHMPVPLDIAQLGHCKNKEQKFFAVLTNLVQGCKFPTFSFYKLAEDVPWVISKIISQLVPHMVNKAFIVCLSCREHCNAPRKPLVSGGQGCITQTNKILSVMKLAPSPVNSHWWTGEAECCYKRLFPVRYMISKL